ncbi:MAG: NADPH-dependent oxidoreductase [Methanobacteriota archaeon]|nr:MAG: NADPH-dependent oxidoreductase [Euryarchaeota archaeon]
MKSVIETLQDHVSIREFIDKPLDDEFLLKLIDNARRSPTSSNMQAYSFIVVKDRQRLKRIAALAGNQKWIESAGAFIAICADTYRLQKATELHGKELAKNFENFLVASVDAALVGMSLSLAAESMGLGTTMVGGIRNNPIEVAKFLGLASGVYAVFGLGIGWPDWDRVKPQKPRLPKEAVIHHETYSTDGLEQHIKDYDDILYEYYRSTGRNSPKAAWSGIIATRFSQGRRPHLKKELETLGFVID